MATVEITLVEEYGRADVISALAAENNGTLKFRILGTNDHASIRSAILAHIPSTHPVTGLRQKKISLREESVGLWSVDVEYGRNPSEYRWTASTDKERIYVARTDGIVYPKVGIVPIDRDRLIGIHDDRVEGVDIHTRKFGFIERHYFNKEYVTDTYKATVSRLVGTVCNAAFRGNDAYETMLTGINASFNDTDLQVPIEFVFEVSRNATIYVRGVSRYTEDNPPETRWENDPDPDNPLITDGVAVVKPGWDYMWFRYVEERDAANLSLLRKPREVYVDQVYEYTSWTALGIG